MTTELSTQITAMATRLSIDPNEMQNIVMNTVMPSKNVTNEQFVSFLAVANEYKLNPLTKEVYAFPAKGGGIQPIVAIDGWLKIINTHPEFNGMNIEFSDEKIEFNGKQIPEFCKVQIHRKDRDHPIEVVEYFDECQRNTDTWKNKPRRMLQHKTVIQAGRYAFGLSGIIDDDEAERFKEAGVIQESQKTEKPTYSEQDFNKNFNKWSGLIQSGTRTTKQIIDMVSTKFKLTDDQKAQIIALEQIIEGELVNENA